jgi:hypothetical protein
MESNTSSVTAQPDGLALLAAAVDALAAEDLAALPDAQAAQRVLELRPLVDRLEGHWLRELAGVDGRGAAGAEQGARRPPPPGGCGPGCAPATARPTGGYRPPARCSAAPWPAPPKR